MFGNVVIIPLIKNIKLWLFIAAVLLIPTIVMAQTDLPSTKADGLGFNGSGPNTIVNTFQQGTNDWLSALQPVAKALFWSLAGLDFIWTCITLVLQHSDFQPWFAGFIRKILAIGFFATVLDNGASWISSIVNFFIGLGGLAGGTNPGSLSPSGIMGAGVQLAGHMLKASASNAGTAITTNPISLLITGVGSLAPALILALGAFVILAGYVMIALHFVLAMVEAYVVVGAGYIFLGFGGSRWTVPYTEKYIGLVVSAGVRIMVLELLIGLGKNLYKGWETIADSIAATPDIFSGGQGIAGWTGVQSEFALVSSVLIYGLLCWQAPQIAANVASGSLSASGGDAVGAASAAGAAAFAGASFGQTQNAAATAAQNDVAQIAQAAAIKGAEVGVSAAMAAATGGGSAALHGVGDIAAAAGGAKNGLEMAAELTPPVPDEWLNKTSESTGGTDVSPDKAAEGGQESEAVASNNAPNQPTGSKGEQPRSSGEAAATKNGTKAAAGDLEAGQSAKTAQEAQAEAARAEADDDAAAAKANETPVLDEIRAATEEEIRAAGNAAREKALENGASPQEAVKADRDARQKARNRGLELVKSAARITSNLDRAVSKLPDTGGRISGATPNVSHGE